MITVTATRMVEQDPRRSPCNATTAAMAAVAILALCLLGGGCRTPLPTGTSPGVQPEPAGDAGGGVADLGFAAPDLARPGVGCASVEYGPVTLDAIELVDPPAALHRGAVLRLQLRFTMRACDYVATTTQQIVPGNATDFVRLTTWLWRQRGLGAGCERMVGGSRMVDVDSDQLSNLRFVASDEAPGGTAFLDGGLAPGPRPTPPCGLAIPGGGACDLDCQCAQPGGRRFRCVPRAPGRGVCARTCAEDSECPDEAPLCDESAAVPSTCSPPRPDGACPHSCALGTLCRAGACRPQARPAVGPCRCSEDCAPTQLCDATGTCFVPCFTVSSCPAGANYCGFGKCGFP